MEIKSTVALNVVTFVKLPGADAELALNPSAKVFREIKVEINEQLVFINFATVTKEAARGTYRNGSINNYSVEMKVEDLLDPDTIVNALGGEPYAVVNKVLKISENINNYLSDVRLKSFLTSLTQ